MSRFNLTFQTTISAATTIDAEAAAPAAAATTPSSKATAIFTIADTSNAPTSPNE